VRIVELSGLPGDAQPGAGASPSQAPFTSAFLGPEDTSEQHQFASQLRDTLAARRAMKRARVQDLRSARPPDAGAVRGARKAGAKYAASELHERLGDDWALFRGYRNSRGGIDQLLLGPSGLVAMMSIYLDAAVRCHGEKWHADKLGKDGQALGEIHLDDRAGRSPSVELNQCADELQELLRSAGVAAGVQRAVLLTHPRSRLESSIRPAVHIFTSTFDLVTWLHKMPKALDRGVRRSIEELITHGEHHPG
jgi:hypothetical protein